MKPKTQMRMGLWGIVILTFMGISHFAFEASNTSAMVIDFINLTLFAVYILGIIRKKPTSVKIVFRVYLVFFVIFVVGLFAAIVIPMISTLKEDIEIPGVLDFVFLFVIILFCAVPVIIMRMGLQGLERVIETERKNYVSI